MNHRRLALMTSVILTALTVPAGAALACAEEEVAPVFAPWGDTSDYAAAPGGLFEGSLDWTSTGSPELVPDANPFAQSAEDTTSVALGEGDAITSPLICLTRWHPHMRFAARWSGRKARLDLDVLWTDDKGKLKSVSLADSDPNQFPAWALSKRVMFKRVLPRDEVIRTVQLRFRVRDDGDETSSWLVDNVFVDPVKKG
jgi:hypothetical protein